MLHPDTEVRFINPQIGNGVFATKLIPKGTLVWVQDDFDRLFTEAEVRALDPLYQEILERYCFINRQGFWVFCWDNTRFINHSFRANGLVTPYGGEIAVRDIPAGEQITNDYGCFNIIEPFDCFPEDGCERTRVMPDDLLHHADQWDALLRDAYPLYSRLEQPLAKLLSAQQRHDLEAVSCGAAEPVSIRHCYYDPASRIDKQSNV